MYTFVIFYQKKMIFTTISLSKGILINLNSFCHEIHEVHTWAFDCPQWQHSTFSIGESMLHQLQIACHNMELSVLYKNLYSYMIRYILSNHSNTSHDQHHSHILYVPTNMYMLTSSTSLHSESKDVLKINNFLISDRNNLLPETKLKYEWSWKEIVLCIKLILLHTFVR